MKYLKIGRDFYSNYPIRGAAGAAATNCEYLVESMKATGEWGNVQYSSLINGINFASDANDADTSGRSLYGLNLDNFGGKSSVESGVDTQINNPIIIQFQQSAAAAMDCYAYFLYDVVFKIRSDGKFLANF